MTGDAARLRWPGTLTLSGNNTYPGGTVVNSGILRLNNTSAAGTGVIRMLDPQTIMVTGLTRDGLFLIEKGKVTRPVKNLRWNESPIVAFNNLDLMTPAERVVSGGRATQNAASPRTIATTISQNLAPRPPDWGAPSISARP